MMADIDQKESGMSPEERASKNRMEEFKLLREEIKSRSEEQRATERYLILADAAIYSSLLATTKAGGNIAMNFQWIAWWLPLVLGWAMLLRECESARMISIAANYIRKHEPEVLGNEGGWETYLDDLFQRESDTKRAIAGTAGTTSIKRRPKGQGRLPFAADWYLPWLFFIGVPAGLAFYETVKVGLQGVLGLVIGAGMAGLALLYIYWNEHYRIPGSGAEGKNYGQRL